MHQVLQGATFHVEHVVPRSRGGSSERNNLAWCCPSCNLHKSDRIAVPAFGPGEPVPLFNPREESWHVHFQWEGHHLVGRTAMGQATIRLLELNHPRRILIRKAEQLLGLFPPLS